MQKKVLTIKLPKPHDGQRDLIATKTRFSVFCCGRRFGKTTLAQIRSCKYLLDGFPVGWFAPTYKYLWEVWDWFLETLSPIVSISNKSEQRIKLITGGVLEFWSLLDNQDAGRSRRYKHIVIDEAAKVVNLESVWSKAIRPTLSDYRGSADFVSTPFGRNYFWHLYMFGQLDDYPDWESWRLPTAANPIIAPEEIEAARQQLPDRIFRQEYLAEFVDETGGVFRNILESIDVGRKTNDDAIVDGVAGIDLARTQDYTVITILDRSGRQAFWHRMNNVGWEAQISTIANICRRYRCRAIVDATGVGDPIYERLRLEGVNAQAYKFTADTKERLVDNLAISLERGALRLMDINEQTQELQVYQYEMRGKIVRTSAPPGLHDDCVIALALACWGVTGSGGYYSAGAV